MRAPQSPRHVDGVVLGGHEDHTQAPRGERARHRFDEHGLPVHHGDLTFLGTHLPRRQNPKKGYGNGNDAAEARSFRQVRGEIDGDGSRSKQALEQLASVFGVRPPREA